MTDNIHRPGWCLVLAMWGTSYSDSFVNVMAERARALGPDCRAVVLLTDRHRPGIRDDVRQVLFEGYLAKPRYFQHGYIAKLSVFRRDALPPAMRCVYLDLDTAVVGDLGRIAALVRAPGEYYMLPPGNIMGFVRLRRAIFRLTRGKVFAKGNSSVIAFSSAAEPNLAETFERLDREGALKGRLSWLDDVFISWFAQERLHAVPTTHAVMFRREFLSRWPWLARLRARMPGTRARRKGLAAITFNGVSYKPDALLALPEGAEIKDPKGRRGVWSDAGIGPVRAQIIDYFRAVTGQGRQPPR